jgi:hypothetical protein
MSEEVKPSPTEVALPKVEGSLAREGLDVIEGFLNSLIVKWEEEQKNTKWLWFFRAKVGIAKCARFVTSATDGFVVLAEKVGEAGNGRAKKTVVTNALDRLYTKVVQPNLPLWLKPFGWAVRLIVIRIIIGTLIDFCVSKYNQGSWSAEKTDAQVQTLMTEVLISQGLKKAAVV